MEDTSEMEAEGRVRHHPYKDIFIMAIPAILNNLIRQFF